MVREPLGRARTPTFLGRLLQRASHCLKLAHPPCTLEPMPTLGPNGAPEIQTNRRWIRSWLPWNRERIFSLTATGADSGLLMSGEQGPAVEPLHGEGNTGAWLQAARGDKTSARRAPHPAPG